MNIINQQNSSAKTFMIIGILGLLFIVIPIGLIGFLVYFDLTYVVPGILAIISLSASVIIAVRKKYVNIYSLVMLMAGLLFLTSGIIEFGLGAFTKNIPFHDQIDFLGIVRPNQVSHGFANIGIGIIFILVNFENIKSKGMSEENRLLQKYKALRIFQLGVGIIFFLLGVFTLINGLRPL